MALPVSAEYPSVPIMQYDPACPPFVPTVNVFPQGVSILPVISALVANEVSAKAHANAARMFCYNLLVNNYWNNENFSEVVKLATDLVCLNLKKGVIRLPEAGASDAVFQTLTLYTCSLMMLYPDLKHLSGPQLLDTAFQNTPIMNNLKQEIADMYNNNPGQPPYPGNNYGNNMNMGGNAHAPMNSVTIYTDGNGRPILDQNGRPIMVQQQPPQQQMAMYQQQMPVQQMPNFPQQMQPQQSGNTWNSSRFPAGQFATTPAAPSPDRYASRLQSASVIPEPTVAPAAVIVKSDEYIYLEIEGGSEVERAKHEIPYLDNTVCMNSMAKHHEVVESVSQLQNAKSFANPESDIVLHKQWKYEACLNSAIYVAKAAKCKVQKENANKMFRCFVAISNPVISNRDITSYMDILVSATSFIDLSTKLKSIGTSLSTTAVNEREYTEDIINFLSEIDNSLTSIVNDFLRNKIRLVAQIESFTDDIEEIGSFLQTKYGNIYYQAFSTFETEVIDCFTTDIDKDLKEYLVSSLELSDDLCMVPISVTYSLTYIPMSSKELGYKLKDTPLIIDPITAPTLHKIAKSLQQHKREMGMSTIYDLLIAADGVRYKLYKNYVQTDQFIIGKA